MNPTDLCFLAATEMAAAIRRREISPVEITEALLARIEALNPALNVFCTPTPRLAREEAARAEQQVMAGGALGPLHGVPYSIKDLIPTKGIRTMRGSHIHRETVPDQDAVVVERLRAAGGIMLGKTTTPEFGWKGVTDSPLTGITRNPWNLEITPGGSSGGGAAQVAAGMGPLAVGTDGGGSLRIPASCTGIFGLKPSYGRVPVYPASGHDMLSHTGPLTRTVADAALMLSVIAGPHEADRLSLEAPPADYLGRLGEGIPGLRVAWSPDLGYARVEPEVATLTARAAANFSALGCEVEEVNPGFGDSRPIFEAMWPASAAGGLAEHLPRWEAKMDAGLVALVHNGMKIPATAFVQAQAERHLFWERVRRFFENYDLLLTPALAVLSFPVGMNRPPSEEPGAEDWVHWTPFTYPFNLTGNPAASIPVGASAGGLPVGLQIVGRRFADLAVLQAAAAYEAAHPWAHHRPAL